MGKLSCSRIAAYMKDPPRPIDSVHLLFCAISRAGCVALAEAVADASTLAKFVIVENPDDPGALKMKFTIVTHVVATFQNCESCTALRLMLFAFSVAHARDRHTRHGLRAEQSGARG